MLEKFMRKSPTYVLDGGRAATMGIDKLMFQKWTVARDIEGLFVQMSIFRHALNGCYRKDHEPALEKLRSRLQAVIDKRQKSPKE